MNEKPPSLIKWTGSKRSQAARIASLFPHVGAKATYFEPFLGGGAMVYYGARLCRRVKASDIYAPLIDLWSGVQGHPEEVVEKYTADWERLQADFPNYFFAVRDRFNRTPNGQDLLFLSRTCVNGIIRFNRKGEFNNSIHLSRRGMKPSIFAKVVNKWSDVLKNASFEVCDYSSITGEVIQGDFVYLDPPYVNSHNRYIKSLDLDNFLVFLETLNSKGVYWALSFDGARGDSDLTYALPKCLYRYHTKIATGASAVQKVLNESIESVDESLYLNYTP